MLRHEIRCTLSRMRWILSPLHLFSFPSSLIPLHVNVRVNFSFCLQYGTGMVGMYLLMCLGFIIIIINLRQHDRRRSSVLKQNSEFHLFASFFSWLS
ncbi:hypothetical protein M432DRAFT_408951 [Thermoascus aurantiacus ATCC 26904]